MKKIFLFLAIMIAFGIEANAQKLDSAEREQLHKKNPKALKVYQERILELEKKIRDAEVQIEFIKTEKALDMGDNDGNAAKIKSARRIEKQEEIIKQAKKDMESANKLYRRMANEKDSIKTSKRDSIQNSKQRK
jgi:hypothetical protein